MKQLRHVFLFTLTLLFAMQLRAQPVVEAAFSPDANAEALVVKTINSAQETIRMAAYSFTSPTVAKSLLSAKKRGVDVKIVIDEKGNKSKASQAAMNLMVNAGIELRTISAYKIHHDKYIIVDGRDVETGSFNYSKSAASSNSENVVLIKDSPSTAASFMRHWQSRWDKGTPWTSSY